jgi:hypothetical protein
MAIGTPFAHPPAKDADQLNVADNPDYQQQELFVLVAPGLVDG